MKPSQIITDRVGTDSVDPDSVCEFVKEILRYLNEQDKPKEECCMGGCGNINCKHCSK